MPHKKCYFSRMDTNEIKQELDRRGWTAIKLAENLGVSAPSLRQVLCGSRPMTKQLEKHIELLFASTRTVFFAFTVDIPDATCRSWVPDWDNLTPKTQAKAVKAVVIETLEKLKKIGYENMTEADRRAMADVMPPSPYGCPGGECMEAGENEE